MRKQQAAGQKAVSSKQKAGGRCVRVCCLLPTAYCLLFIAAISGTVSAQVGDFEGRRVAVVEVMFEGTPADVEARLCNVDGGYVALANEQLAGVILLNVEVWRSLTRIENIIVGRQFRRYGIGSLLLNCASDWARNHGCWAILLETQNVNYPAIQFYLRNGLEVWSINQHYYPPGPVEHEIAIFMGKRLRSIP